MAKVDKNEIAKPFANAKERTYFCIPSIGYRLTVIIIKVVCMKKLVLSIAALLLMTVNADGVGLQKNVVQQALFVAAGGSSTGYFHVFC